MPLKPPLEEEKGWTVQNAPALQKWERPGETVFGKLLGISMVTLDGKRVPQYLLASNSSHTIKMLGTYDLTQKLTRRHIGMLVRIKYRGQDESIKGGPNNTPMKVFDVHTRPDPDAPTPAPDTTPSGPPDRDTGPITDDDIPF